MLEELTRIDFIRSGSMAPRFNYCGKANCRCHGDPPQAHGPYLQRKAKVNGKTVNRRLSAREADLYRSGSATIGAHVPSSVNYDASPRRPRTSYSRPRQRSNRKLRIGPINSMTWGFRQDTYQI